MTSLFKKIGIFLLGGAWVGFCFRLVPYHPAVSEARNFQILLLESSYQFLERLFPLSVVRFLGTAAGETIIFMGLGGLVGLAVGILLSLLEARIGRRWGVHDFMAAISVTTGIFFCLWALSWSRIALIHSSTLRMISFEGIGMIVASLAVGIGIGWFLLKILRRLPAVFKPARVFTAVSLIVLVFFIGLHLTDETASSTSARGVAPTKVSTIVFFGVDGATWEVALPMMREGKLPHLAQLMRRGAWGDIRTTLPWKSPILWSSIATGKREKAHGIHDFVVRDPISHLVVPVSFSSRKVKAVWDIAGDAGFRVDVVGWYGTWPVEPVNGTMISYRLVLQNLSHRIFPEERAPEIEKFVDRLRKPTAPEPSALISETEIPMSESPLDEAVAAEVGLYLLKKDRPDLHFIYLREVDDMQHFFWKDYAFRRGSLLARVLYGPIDPVELERKGRRIESAYEKADVVLGKIMELSGPDTVIVVVSDHGGGIKAEGELNFNLDPLLEQWGLLNHTADGKSIDWSRTAVYDSTKRAWYEKRELFVNLRADGPFGPYFSGVKRDQILESLAQRLKRLKTKSGHPLARSVAVEHSMDEPVHLSVRLNVRLDQKDAIEDGDIHVPVSKILWPTDLTGTHRMQGLVVLAGPGIRPGYRLRAASILDMTPTLLYFLNLPVADDMAGRVLLEAVEPALRRSRPVKRIPTYETGPVRTTVPASGSSSDPELLDRLRSLGYIQ